MNRNIIKRFLVFLYDVSCFIVTITILSAFVLLMSPFILFDYISFKFELWRDEKNG